MPAKSSPSALARATQRARIGRGRGRLQAGLAPVALGVAIIDMTALDLGREGGGADDMDSDVGPLQRLLELDRAPAYPLELGQVLVLERRHHRAHAAHRLVDDPAMLLAEGEHRL